MRLFVAVDLDPARQQAVTRVVGDLRCALDQEGWASALRWVAADHRHLTLRFLGERDQASGARIGSALTQPIALAPFDVVFEGAGVFPPQGAPRVLWLGIGRGGDGLAELFDAVEVRLRTAGVEPEQRPFSPHLTLARFRNRARGGRRAALGAALAAVRVDAGAMPVQTITLYESRLGASGAQYRRLVSASLTTGQS
jgi:2'-5' RNA ligase